VDAETVAGVVLVAGLVVFLVGAVRWRLEYQADAAIALPAMHADPRRWTWIHAWMAAAMFVTPAGLAMAASVVRPDDAAATAWAATVVFTVGAACLLVSLTYRLAVVPWAAGRFVAEGNLPELYLATDPWASLLFRAHMLSAYATFVVLGAAVVLDDGLPVWLGWLGVGWGVAFGALMALGGRMSYAVSPPFWAHTYPAVVGVALVAT
jgi:uncharacterized membrane protein YtjA (UPF0391 family)